MAARCLQEPGTVTFQILLHTADFDKYHGLQEIEESAVIKQQLVSNEVELKIVH